MVCLINKHDVIKYINDGFVSNARVQVVFDEEQALANHRLGSRV